MSDLTATAVAHPNIAFIKYWGDVDAHLRLPANGSISMNLAGLVSETTVSFDPALSADSLTLNDEAVSGGRLERVSRFLDLVRGLAGKHLFASVRSRNNFPTGAGIASSASAFAALALSASQAIGLDLTEPELSRLARKGSGSACRSVPGGFVEWLPGDGDESSYAVSIAPADHWQLVDCIAVVRATPKRIGSTQGHALAGSSPLQAARIQDAPRRLEICRSAIAQRDFQALAEIIELDSNAMHAVMMTSSPPLFYWEPASVSIMKAIRRWRGRGCPAAYTLDAGPNVHVLCDAGSAQQIKARLLRFPGVEQVLLAAPGGPAELLDS